MAEGVFMSGIRDDSGGTSIGEDSDGSSIYSINFEDTLLAASPDSENLLNAIKTKFNKQLEIIFEKINEVPLDVALPAATCRFINDSLRQVWEARIGLALACISAGLKDNKQIDALVNFMDFEHLKSLQSAQEIDDFTRKCLDDAVQELKRLLAAKKTISQPEELIDTKNKIQIYRQAIWALKAGRRELKAYTKAVKKLDSFANTEDIEVSSGQAAEQVKSNNKSKVFAAAGAVLSGTLGSLLFTSKRAAVNLALTPLLATITGAGLADVPLNYAASKVYRAEVYRGTRINNLDDLENIRNTPEFKAKLRRAKLKGVITWPILFSVGFVIGIGLGLGATIVTAPSDMKQGYKMGMNKIYENKVRLIVGLTMLENISQVGFNKKTNYERYMSHIRENIDMHRPHTSRSPRHSF